MLQTQSAEPREVELTSPVPAGHEPLWPAMGWWKHVLIAVLLFLVVFLSYSNSGIFSSRPGAWFSTSRYVGESGMVLDNKYIIEEYYKALLRQDPNHDLKSWKQVGLIFQNDYWWPKGISGLYRPITTFTYWIDYVLLTGKPDYKTEHNRTMLDKEGKPVPMSWRDYAYRYTANSPYGELSTYSYHWINLLLHWVNAVLVYFVSLTVIKRLWPAMFVAALFAAHPIATESVTNIIGRADLVAATATFGGLLLYIRGTRATGSWALPWVVGAALMLTFGVFSKESAAAIPLVFIGYDITYRWTFGNKELEGFPPLLAHGVLYLCAVLGIGLGLPALASFASTKLDAVKTLPTLWHWVIAITAMLIGLTPYVATLKLDRPMRVATLGGFTLCSAIACWFLPWWPLLIVAAVIGVELARGSLTSVNPRYRVTAHATLYLPLYFALIAMPVAALWGYRYMNWDTWDATGSVAAYADSVKFDRQMTGNTVIPPAPPPPGTIVTDDKKADKDRLITNPVRENGSWLAWNDYLGRPLSWVGLTAYQDWIERYLAASVAFGLGLLLHLTTCGSRVRSWINSGIKLMDWSDRDVLDLPTPRAVRSVALVGIALAAVVASFYSYWVGILLALIVALHEVILGTLTRAGRDREYRRDWHLIWNGFAINYLALIPPLIALFTVRAWVFANSSPAETPFLDNPIRGIWQVRELGLPSFEKELAAKPLLGMSLIECKMTAVKIMGRLLLLVSWPKTLCSDYSYAQIPNFSFTFKQGWDDVQGVLALIALVGIFIVSPFFLYKRNKALMFYIVFFFFAALPTSNFFLTIGSVMAERFMYLPLTGFTGALVIIVFWAAKKLWDVLDSKSVDNYFSASGAATAFLAGVVVLYAGRAWMRNFDWHSDKTLWEAAIVDSPKSFRCYQSLAFAYYEEHPTANIEKMINTARGAKPLVDVLPNHLNSSRLYLHLGMYYSIKAELNCGRRDDGSLYITPTAEQWYHNAVDVLEQGVQVDRAFNEVNKAKERLRGTDPALISDAGLGPIYGTLAMAYARLGNFDAAMKRLAYQRQLEPNEADSYMKMATIQLAQRKYDDAAVTLIECILIDPSRKEVWQTLAQLYSSANVQGAVISPDGVNVRLNLGNPVVRDNLCSAYRDFIRIFRRAHRDQMAQEARKAAVQRYDFPKTLFDDLFNEHVYTVTPEGLE